MVTTFWIAAWRNTECGDYVGFIVRDHAEFFRDQSGLNNASGTVSFSIANTDTLFEE